jgi:hypothetical protein
MFSFVCKGIDIISFISDAAEYNENVFLRAGFKLASFMKLFNN